MNYKDFLRTKSLGRIESGISHGELSQSLFPYQRDAVAQLLAVGRGAAFLDTGLGKTAVQLEWANHISRECPVLILAPLAVADQTRREGIKFGVDVQVCRSQSDVSNRIVVANYERIHQFDPEHFGAVVMDESSILKSIDSKTRNLIQKSFGHTQYRLACSATPAPNDYMELGQQSEVLGVMRFTDMLSRWFINDASNTGEWRLKGHARKDFWQWIKSWSVMASRPSDLGDTDTVYELPELKVLESIVPMDYEQSGDDLFGAIDLSATGIRKEKRKSLTARAERVAELASGSDHCIVWTDTNDESQLCTSLIPDAVEVTGSMSLDQKEEHLRGFSDGAIRVLVTKPSIAGFGLNWQHCNRMVFAGATYSYEKFYQAVRRCWRFGQTRPVTAYMVMSEPESVIWSRVKEKAEKHQSMVREVLAA